MRYIGSKRRILSFIEEVIYKKVGEIEDLTVADLFAGTACVGERFKQLGARVITNDYLSFSYALQIAKIKLNNEPKGKITYIEAITILNALHEAPGFFYQEYTMEGTEGKEFIRNYFSVENAKKIDVIRHQIEEWRQQTIIDDDLFWCLCASLADAITKVSNTSGTYGAFLKNDDKRKYKALELEPFDFFNNGKQNECYCCDIFDLINEVEGEILYLDPPYNNRQYPPYYHILETAVKYDSPAIYGKTGRRPYEDQMSPFCIKLVAETALIDVIERAKFEHIFISYSTDGIVDIDNLANKLNGQYEVQIFHREHRRYKSNSNGDANKRRLKELILYVHKR